MFRVFALSVIVDIFKVFDRSGQCHDRARPWLTRQIGTKAVQQ